MVSVLASSVVDRGFEPRSGQTKDYKIDICCFGAKHTAFGSKSKDWLGRNQDNASTCTRFILLNIIINRIQETKVSYVLHVHMFRFNSIETCVTETTDLLSMFWRYLKKKYYWPPYQCTTVAVLYHIQDQYSTII